MRDDPGKMPSRPDNSDSEQVQKSWACWFNKARVSCGSNIQTESPCFGSSTLPSTHTILHAINFFSLSTSQAVLPRESTDATVRWKRCQTKWLVEQVVPAKPGCWEFSRQSKLLSCCGQVPWPSGQLPCVLFIVQQRPHPVLATRNIRSSILQPHWTILHN